MTIYGPTPPTDVGLNRFVVTVADGIDGTDDAYLLVNVIDGKSSNSSNSNSSNTTTPATAATRPVSPTQPWRSRLHAGLPAFVSHCDLACAVGAVVVIS